MTIQKNPFVSYDLEKNAKGRIFTIRLNPEERKLLDQDKRILQQEKDSTALKQLAEIGHFVLHYTSAGKILRLFQDNKRRNKRIGILEVE